MYYAKIDSKNIVEMVLVCEEKDAEKWLQKHVGGTWIETSHTGEIRKNFAGIGMTYDSELDAFIPPKPFDSWVLNEETAQWEAPTPKPEGSFYWDEKTISWVEIPTEETNG
jgi:hypothetical protein